MARQLKVASTVGVAAANATAYQCPGSGSFIHASMKVTATASATCADVQAEIEARAGGNGWVDPHNGGIYSVLDSSSGIVSTQRTTNPATSVGGTVYTDKQIFVLTDEAGGCKIEACSESQGTSVGDFSTNYCDVRNLYCGSADNCKTVSHDFTHTEDSHKGSIGAGHDASVCIVSSELQHEALEADAQQHAASSKYTCPGSDSWIHAWMEVTAKTSASCEDVQEEIEARAGADSNFEDPHNGGVYSIVGWGPGIVNTKRTTNPATAVGGQVYTDKQTFILTGTDDGGCEIMGCSESQGFSIGDFSTNYCDLRNLYCGSADGCAPVSKDFTHSETSHTGSIGSGHDSGVCIVSTSVSV